jgi:hypothetical protein
MQRCFLRFSPTLLSLPLLLMPARLAFTAETQVPASYVAYRFAPAEGWHTHGAGDVGATRLEGRRWTFDFSRGAESVSLGLPDRSLLGRVEKLRLRLRRAAKGHPVHLFLHTHFTTFHKVVGEFAGNDEYELVIDAPPGSGWQWFGGENDGKLHGPLRLGEVRLEANGLKDSGTLELVSMTVESSCPPDRLCVMTATTAAERGPVAFLADVRALSDQGLSGDLSWIVHDWDGEELQRGQRTLTLPPRGEPLMVEALAPRFPANLKFAEAEFSLAIPGQSVPKVQACWLAPAQPYDDTTLRPESPFGMGIYLGRFGYPEMEQVARMAGAAGVKWSREDFEWASLEPERGKFNWEYHDKLLDCARRNGITVYAIVMGWPSWAKAYTADGLDDYATFLRELVKHYGKQIKQWEIWNEPNIFFWQGPKPLYADLLIKSYKAIKETDPAAEVLGLSTAGIDFNFIEQMLARQTPFDVLTIHPYRKMLDDQAFINDLKKVADLVKLPDGRSRPVWLTEMGWATHVPHNALSQDFQPNTQRAQAELIARTYLCSIVSGVEPRTFWYDFRDDGDDPLYFEHNMGIVTRDFRPKPAYLAYATLARVLKGMKIAGRVVANEGTFAYRFVPERGAAGEVLAVWNPQRDTSISLPVSARRVTRVNAIGERRELRTSEAIGANRARTVRVELKKGAPVYVVSDGP